MDESAQRLPPLLHIDGFGGILVKFQIRYVVYLVVRNWQPKAVTKCFQRSGAHFFLLMGNVLRLARFTHAVTLDGFGKDHGRLPGMPGAAA